MDEKITPVQAMRLALREARAGTGFVAPNPLVGCTILDSEDRLLAVGAHRKLGQDHAEIDALKKLQSPEQLKGAHVFVTLEPCAHQGRTPSCARELVRHQPASVTFAVQDPFPQVSGRGAAILQQAGIKTQLFSQRSDVDAGDRQAITEEAEDLAEIFLHNFRRHRPFVAVKIAATLDGQIALKNGDGKWITSLEARRHSHHLRARYDAIAVGVETLLSDNPSLDIRLPEYAALKNHVVILDPRGRSADFLPQANVLKVRPAENVVVVTTESCQSRFPKGVRTLRVATQRSGEFEIDDLLLQLGERGSVKDQGLSSLMIEGGAKTVGSFFTAGRVDRLHLYQAPTVLGGLHGLSWSSAFGFRSLKDQVRFARLEQIRVGQDLYQTGRVAES